MLKSSLHLPSDYHFHEIVKKLAHVTREEKKKLININRILFMHCIITYVPHIIIYSYQHSVLKADRFCFF